MVVRDDAMPGFRTALARLFTIQAAFTYERMLGIGFGFAAEPLLRGLGSRDGGTPAFRAALARQSRFFNAHPYFASLAVGAAARAEVDGVPPERIERLRSALIGPLGSLGDRLIWAGWLPACAAVGLLLVAFSAGAWAVLAFLVLYNVMHVWLRVWGLKVGWRAGVGVAGALASPGLQRALELVPPLAALLVGAALPAVLGWYPFAGRWEMLAGAAAALLFAEVVRLLQGRATGLVVAAFALAVVVVVGVAW
jgi:PTS system mannose-specific IID component